MINFFTILFLLVLAFYTVMFLLLLIGKSLYENDLNIIKGMKIIIIKYILLISLVWTSIILAYKYLLK